MTKIHFSRETVTRMPIFQTEEQLYLRVQEVFAMLAETPEQTESFSHSNLVLRLSLRKPDAEILVDGRQPPLEVFYGKRPGEANITLTLEADLLHQIWLGEKDLSQMLFNGQIETKGNLMRATAVIDLMMACQYIYGDLSNKE